MTERGFWFDLENHKPSGWDKWWESFKRFQDNMARADMSAGDFYSAVGINSTYESDFRLGKKGTYHSTIASDMVDALQLEDEIPHVIAFKASLVKAWQDNKTERHALASKLDEMLGEEKERIASANRARILEELDSIPSPAAPSPSIAESARSFTASDRKATRPTALRKIGRLNATLLERAEGNSGTFDAPDVEVELVFGEEEVDDALDDAPAVMQLHACSLRVDFEGGSIVKPLVGEDVSFNISYRNADGQRVDTRVPFMPNVAGNSPAHWDAETQRGRRLYGTSSRELLCQFSQRPDTLSVSLVANPHSLRLFKRAESGELEPVKTKDMVGRVVALLARMEVLGEDVATSEEFRIDGGDLIR